MNTNPRCSRCGGETYRASQTCFPCGRDNADYGPLYVSEKRDVWPVEGRYPDGRADMRSNLHPTWAEEVPLPGFEEMLK